MNLTYLKNDIFPLTVLNCRNAWLSGIRSVRCRIEKTNNTETARYQTNPRQSGIPSPELEFLNKCQIPVFWNPRIWGEGEFIDVLYNILKLVWDFQGSLTVGFFVNPANSYFTDPGSILSYITFTQFQLIKFVNNNSVNSISGEKWRSYAKEPVWKSNPWISAPTKCLWIPTLFCTVLK